MVLTFFALFFSVRVHATGTLGATKLGNPSGTSHYYVYFGNSSTSTSFTYNNSANISTTGTYKIDGPILFRVLNTTSNGYLNDNSSDRDGLFMMSEYGVCERTWHYLSYGGCRQTWSNSEMRDFLNGTTYSGASRGNVLGTCFSAAEQAAIAQTTTTYDANTGTALYWFNDDRATQYDTKNKTNNLSGDKLFLLSAEEVTNTQGVYGFNFSTASSGYRYTFKNKDICKVANSSSYWWLRSASSGGSYGVAGVYSSGESRVNISYHSYAVRFALNVHLASIITSEASLSGSVATVSSTFKAIDTPTMTGTTAPALGTTGASVHKLIIASGAKDSSFHITETSVTGRKSENITLNYSGGGSGYIGALIKNGSSSYYAREASSSASGTVTFTLPSDISYGTYTMLVYDETYNGGQKTSEAKYDEVTLTVQSDTPPTITKVYRNSANTGFKVTARDNNALSKIADTSGNQYVALSGTSATKNFTTSSAIPSFIVYDNANNTTTYTIASSSPLPILDSMPPTGDVVYNGEGSYTITAQDEGSGLWKVMIGDTTVIDGTTTATNYPTTIQSYTGQGPIGAPYAIAYDAVNNQYSIPIDNVVPTCDSITYDQGTYTIKVTDSDSGLWKIADTSGTALTGGDYSSSYPKTQTTYTGTGPVAKIMLYDAAGNHKEVSLDNVEPSIQRAYKKGTSAIIEASDTGSGLWKITESVGGAAKVTLSGTSDIVKFTVSSGVTTVYVYDHAGNYKEVDLSSEYTEEPQVSVAYGNGEYTITATAANTGLWKIIDAGGTVLPSTSYNGEASYSDYPTSSQTYRARGPVPTGTVYIYDAVSNITQLDLDNLGPTIRRAYKKGSNAFIEATDEGSGLYKITESTDADAQANAQLTGTNQSVRFTMVGQTAYVYDQAGNYVIVTE